MPPHTPDPRRLPHLQLQKIGEFALAAYRGVCCKHCRRTPRRKALAKPGYVCPECRSLGRR